jgi:hypothetical protein
MARALELSELERTRVKFALVFYIQMQKSELRKLPLDSRQDAVRELLAHEIDDCEKILSRLEDRDV